MRIPVISLSMPWGFWVSLGWKPTETRTHKRFAGLKGKRIGIHVSCTWDKNALTLAHNYLQPWQREKTADFLRIGGAIICTAFVEDFRKLTAEDSQAALIDCGGTERYGLILKDVQSIEAIPCKGRLGIWYVDISGEPSK